MLKRSLLELAVGSFFSSQGLAKVLCKHLQDYPRKDFLEEEGEILREKCYSALVTSLDENYPRRFRLNDIRHVFANFWRDELFSKPGLSVLDDLFKRLMLRNGDYVEYQGRHVQAYARLASELDPALLVGWHLSAWLKELSPEQASNVQRVISSQWPFFAPRPVDAHVYAEGHVHLGGITVDSIILSNEILATTILDKKNSGTILRLRRVLALLLFNNDDSGAHRALASACKDVRDPMAPADLPVDWELQYDMHRHSTPLSSNWLLGQLAWAMKDGQQGKWKTSSEAWLWLIVFLWHRYSQVKTPLFIRIAIMYFFVELMSTRRQLIMDGQGLTRFTERYFPNSLRKNGKAAAPKDNFKLLMPGRGDLAETKATPSAFQSEDIAKIAETIAASRNKAIPNIENAFGFNDFSKHGVVEKAYTKVLEQWHFCGHFTRSADKAREGGSGALRAKADSAKLWKEASQLQHNLGRAAGWSHKAFLGGHLNPNFEFQPGRWFRGLDVAGDENALRIEWFAPVLRWLRQGFLSRPDGEQASSGFHFSIHAGEDYSHPYSGLRHIDETVRFSEMRSGDRLGHALALGIEPQNWISRNGDMILPIDEHLDNLVWAWHYACELSARLPIANQVIPILQQRIARAAVYGAWLCEPSQLDQACQPSCNCYTATKTIRREAAQLSPATLFNAWLLRRNCHYMFQQNVQANFPDARVNLAVPDLKRLQAALTIFSDERTHLALSEVERSQAILNNTRAYTSEEIYLKRHLHLKGKCQNVPLALVQTKDTAQARDTAHADELQHHIFYDVESDEEIIFMNALQDYLLEKYDQKGLILETNPSSNVYIARLENHAEHPIFRWYPPDEDLLQPGAKYNKFGLRRGPIRVLINTDDPGIMPTTLRTEYALLCEAAIDQGFSRTTTEEWLERLRCFGISQFHRNHLPVFIES